MIADVLRISSLRRRAAIHPSLSGVSSSSMQSTVAAQLHEKFISIVSNAESILSQILNFWDSHTHNPSAIRGNLGTQDSTNIAFIISPLSAFHLVDVVCVPIGQSVCHTCTSNKTIRYRRETARRRSAGLRLGVVNVVMDNSDEVICFKTVDNSVVCPCKEREADTERNKQRQWKDIMEG